MHAVLEQVMLAVRQIKVAARSAAQPLPTLTEPVRGLLDGVMALLSALPAAGEGSLALATVLLPAGDLATALSDLQSALATVPPPLIPTDVRSRAASLRIRLRTAVRDVYHALQDVRAGLLPSAAAAGAVAATIACEVPGCVDWCGVHVHR
jgi:hypothetical protein